ncbi:hypothetical protein DV096_12505 [Bradymonadaceae bacterium TMQ3]|uniref:Uncharacterized protein n=1 Tax=Lujinxingia sediminis TaxID=2480984 RepID=A0ABY0CQH6_9DELT|nr:hypothetical protein [Lujinxingia sediminis]RDV37922.1 hypothetical protein DV096_12505 [Bradymonadaceae bacterium TMQ3]RVU42750.1 hypothetical protein EA187_14650 [Lujinxingia sediminis]TXC75300.1 hypothetical protein FRC91_11280 [Bradymonadales bacterium TMQ1]
MVELAIPIAAFIALVMAFKEMRKSWGDAMAAGAMVGGMMSVFLIPFGVFFVIPAAIWLYQAATQDRLRRLAESEGDESIDLLKAQPPQWKNWFWVVVLILILFSLVRLFASVFASDLMGVDDFVEEGEVEEDAFFHGFKGVMWGTSIKDVQNDLSDFELIEEKLGFVTLVSRGELGRTPAFVSYGFDPSGQLCAGAYGVNKVKFQYVNGGEVDVDSLEEGALYDFNMGVVKEQTVDGLISKYGAASEVRENIVFWDVSEGLLIVFVDVSEFAFALNYVHPDCAGSFLGEGYAHRRGDETIMEDL